MAKENIFAGLPENLPKGKEEPPKPVLPQELQGKTPEEIYKMLQEEHNKVIGNLDLQHQLEVEKAKGQAAAPTKQPEQQFTPPFTPPMGGTGEEEEPNILTQPDKYMDMAFQKRVGPLVASWLESQRSVNRQLFRQTVGEAEFERYKDSIEPFVDRLSPQMQIRPESYQAAYKIARGDKVDEIAKEKAEAMAADIVRKTLAAVGINPQSIPIEKILGQQPPPQQPSRPISSLFQGQTGTIPHTEGPKPFTNPNEPVKPGLTDLQKQMAKSFGMTEEEYAEYGKFNTDMMSQLGRQQ